MVHSMTAFALCRRRFRESKLIMGMYIFTMVFGAGLIPGYLLVRNLGLYDSLWALILPVIINPYYLLIMR